jgi:hypothetical protein
MTDPPKAGQSTRQRQRLSAALRENLKRRKAQARRRAAAGDAAESAGKSHDSAEIGADKGARDRSSPR